MRLQKVTNRFRFGTNAYYLSLIDWDDPDDPIRRLVIPGMEELERWGDLDVSHEDRYTVMPGLQHKYRRTAVLLVSDACGGICRYCFRKRIFIHKNGETLKDLHAALRYIAEHEDITNVLLTGGDALMLPTARLEAIVRAVMAIEHVRIVRLGSKMAAFYPYRILEDPSLAAMIRKHTTREKKIYLMNHFAHPRELTDVAVEAVNMLREAGAAAVNQMPLIRKVNDDPEVLAELFRKLAFSGVQPYYVFQCRPAVGNKAYAVPIEEGYEIFEQAKALVSGLAKRARFVMSHTTGKIEVVGKTDEYVFFKYHQAANEEDCGRFLAFRSNPSAYWFDDYAEALEDCPLGILSRTG